MPGTVALSAEPATARYNGRDMSDQIVIVAGVGLFVIRLNSDASWWTGHLVYFLSPR